MRPAHEIQPNGQGPIDLAIFDTHPIQYRSPVFKELTRKLPGTHVYYFSDTFEGRRWWFREYGKVPKLDFNLPLKEGFYNETLSCRSPLAFLRAILPVLKRSSAVLIYGYYLWEHWAILLIAKTRGVPVIFIGETFDLGHNKMRRLIKKLILPFLLHSLDRIVTIGNKNCAYYQSLRVKPARLVRARYCVDEQFFATDDGNVSHAATRKQYGIPETAFILLFVGRLFGRKRPFDVIDIHQRLFEKFPQLHTVLVGSGELASRLREASAEIPRLNFIGALDQPAVRRLYYASHCLIVPSEFETWGLVVNEAMHCGIPAIVTETCGVADDLVITGETGYTYAVGDTHTAARLISRLINDPSLQQDLSRRCRERAAGYGVKQFAQSIATAVTLIRAEENGSRGRPETSDSSSL